METCKCSTCNTVILNKRYKCASCQKFNLCRSCYRCVKLFDFCDASIKIYTAKSMISIHLMLSSLSLISQYVRAANRNRNLSHPYHWILANNVSRLGSTPKNTNFNVTLQL